MPETVKNCLFALFVLCLLSFAVQANQVEDNIEWMSAAEPYLSPDNILSIESQASGMGGAVLIEVHDCITKKYVTTVPAMEKDSVSEATIKAWAMIFRSVFQSLLYGESTPEIARSDLKEAWGRLVGEDKIRKREFCGGIGA